MTSFFLDGGGAVNAASAAHSSVKERFSPMLLLMFAPGSRFSLGVRKGGEGGSEGGGVVVSGGGGVLGAWVGGNVMRPTRTPPPPPLRPRPCDRQAAAAAGRRAT
eukprot:6060983-Pleurochrysis_carterae.AAC.3